MHMRGDALDWRVRLSSSFVADDFLYLTFSRGKKISSDILVMRKVIKIQNIFKLLIRNLNDVIKKGNTGENVTHSWNFGSCIINS